MNSETILLIDNWDDYQKAVRLITFCLPADAHGENIYGDKISLLPFVLSQPQKTAWVILGNFWNSMSWNYMLEFDI